MLKRRNKVNEVEASRLMPTALIGQFYGIGVGTGDPELLTLKAVRLIEAADIVCYLKNRNRATFSPRYCSATSWSSARIRH